MTLTVHGWVVPSAELARRLLVLYPARGGDTRVGGTHTVGTLWGGLCHTRVLNPEPPTRRPCGTGGRSGRSVSASSSGEGRPRSPPSSPPCVPCCVPHPVSPLSPPQGCHPHPMSPRPAAHILPCPLLHVPILYPLSPSRVPYPHPMSLPRVPILCPHPMSCVPILCPLSPSCVPILHPLSPSHIPCPHPISSSWVPIPSSPTEGGGRVPAGTGSPTTPRPFAWSRRWSRHWGSCSGRRCTGGTRGTRDTLGCWTSATRKGHGHVRGGHTGGASR